jgi:hypothetical protein
MVVKEQNDIYNGSSRGSSRKEDERIGKEGTKL